MYPDEFGSIQVDQRQFIKPDYNDPNFNPITAPQYPPTKIQISVLDVVPAVWASEFIFSHSMLTPFLFALSLLGLADVNNCLRPRRSGASLEAAA